MRLKFKRCRCSQTFYLNIKYVLTDVIIFLKTHCVRAAKNTISIISVITKENRVYVVIQCTANGDNDNENYFSTNGKMFYENEHPLSSSAYLIKFTILTKDQENVPQIYSSYLSSLILKTFYEAAMIIKLALKIIILENLFTFFSIVGIYKAVFLIEVCS